MNDFYGGDQSIRHSHLSEEVATSIDEADRLLESNAKLSVSYLALRLKDIERELLASIRAFEARLRSELKEREERLVKLEKRLSDAASVVKDMQGRLMKMESERDKENDSR